ncbi:MAG: hypothetical protein NC411_01130 [Bacteroides sp.]|nr:hypothetical protein [Bacteroides sp.]
MKKKRIIMSWGKVIGEVGYTGENGEFAEKLFSVGTINDKSTSLTSNDGETLTAKATGGITVAEEDGEPEIEVTMRVKEMDFDTEHLFNGAEENKEGELVVKTNNVEREFSLKLTPKNIGAKGLKAPCCHVKFRPGSSEEEGSFVDLTFKILPGADDELYRFFRVKATDKANIVTGTDFRAELEKKQSESAE